MAEIVRTRTANVSLSYVGLQAAEHHIDMRRFGYALVGLDHVITYGIIALTERRLARPRERLDFDVVVSEPKQGSVEVFGALMAAYQGTQGSLPFITQLLNEAFPDLLWHWLSWSFKSLGGRGQEAEPHFVKLMEFCDHHLDRISSDKEKDRQFFLQVLDRVKPHASSVAMPVGQSSEVLRIRRPGNDNETILGVAEAEAIRAKEPVEVGDARMMQIRIDGVIKHTTRGSVELFEEPGRYFPVEFRDPIFDQTPNPYISSMNSSELLLVNAVPAYRSGELYKLYVMGLGTKE